MGGAKISDKIKLIENLLDKADKILIGGGMANTFLKAQGHNMGKSLVEEEALPEAKRLLEMAADRLILPVDVVTATEVSNEAAVRSRDGLGAVAGARWRSTSARRRWSGSTPSCRGRNWSSGTGRWACSRWPQFANGTNQLAQMLASMVDHGAKVIIGGGDSAAAVRKAGLTDKMTHVSTGGGASLELLEGRELPGVVALDEK
jgi:phosphoglycerate kinase